MGLIGCEENVLARYGVHTFMSAETVLDTTGKVLDKLDMWTKRRNRYGIFINGRCVQMGLLSPQHVADYERDWCTKSKTK